MFYENFFRLRVLYQSFYRHDILKKKLDVLHQRMGLLTQRITPQVILSIRLITTKIGFICSMYYYTTGCFFFNWLEVSRVILFLLVRCITRHIDFLARRIKLRWILWTRRITTRHNTQQIHLIGSAYYTSESFYWFDVSMYHTSDLFYLRDIIHLRLVFICWTWYNLDWLYRLNILHNKLIYLARLINHMIDFNGATYYYTS